MTVQELITQLMEIKDKTKVVKASTWYGIFEVETIEERANFIILRDE